MTRENRKKIEKRGVIFKDYGLEFTQFSPESNPTLIQGAYLFCNFAKQTIDKFLLQWKKENYDLIIHDSCAYAGVVLEKLLDVKAINSTTTMFYTPKIVAKTSLDLAVSDFVASFVRTPADWFKFLWTAFKFKRDYGVFPSSLAVLTSRTDMNVTYTSSYLQPLSESLDPYKYRFLGAVIEPRERDSSFPYERLEKGRVIYISLGTVYTTNAQFLETVLKP